MCVGVFGGSSRRVFYQVWCVRETEAGDRECKWWYMMRYENKSEEMVWGSGSSVASSLVAEDITHSDEQRESFSPNECGSGSYVWPLKA